MADTNILPPSHSFDETGVLPENYIENEMRFLADRTYRAVAPRFGAFFIEGFRIRDGNGNDIPKSKYQYALYNNTLSAKCGKDVIGAIVITDPTVISPIYMDYHCVGGPWGASNERIIEMFYELMKDRPVAWPNILGKPDAYKPAHHFQDIGDLYGAEYFVEALERLTDAILMGDSASHDEIWRRMDEMRTELKGNIDDLSKALNKRIDDTDAALRQLVADTKADLTQQIANLRSDMNAADNAINQRITNVQNTLQGNIDAVARSLSSHVGDWGNPHHTTVGQVGTYSTTDIDAKDKAIKDSLTNYVKKDTNENLSLSIAGGQLFGYVNGVWQIIWPAQWS